MNERCRHFREEIEAYVAGDLPSEEKQILEGHLSSCEACQRELEKEKKILGLFQSLEKQPAPELLRTRIMEHIPKDAASRKTLLKSLDRIFIWPRIRVLTGAVAALLLLFWGIRLFHQPIETEKPAPVDADRREKFRGDYSYNREAKGPEERKAGSSTADTLGYEKKDMGRESAESGIKKEKIMASPPASQAQAPAPEQAQTSGAKQILSLHNGIMENEKAGFAARSAEERLKGIGAVQIQKLKESNESRGAQYAFFISQQDFDNMQNNTSLKNIRILKVRDRMDASQLQQSLRRQAAGETLGIQSKDEDIDLLKKKAKAARSEIPQLGSAPAGSSPKQAFSAPSSAISGAIKSSPTQEPLFSMMQKPQTQEMDEGITTPKSIGGALDKSSPTTLTLEEKRRSMGLTSQAALLYVEIEVEPIK